MGLQGHQAGNNGLESPGAASDLLSLMEFSWHFLLHPAEWIWAIIYPQSVPLRGFVRGYQGCG